MNLFDIVILILLAILFALAIRKLINNYKCINKGGGCAGCALSGSCHKEILKQKQAKR